MPLYRQTNTLDSSKVLYILPPMTGRVSYPVLRLVFNQPAKRPYPDPPKSVLKKSLRGRIISRIHRIELDPGHIAR